MFTWIKVYNKIAIKLLDYENRQIELIKLLGEIKEKGIPTISINDNNIGNELIPLTQIDPFTFFASWNRGITETNRIAILRIVLEFFDLNIEPPNDFNGIPILNNLKSWFFSYKNKRNKNDISNLWKLFKEAMNENIKHETLNAIFKQKGIKYNITIALFWIKSDNYINLDEVNRSYFKSKNISDFDVINSENYFNILNEVKNKFLGIPFSQISYNAWAASNNDINLNYLKNDILSLVEKGHKDISYDMIIKKITNTNNNENENEIKEYLRGL